MSLHCYGEQRVDHEEAVMNYEFAYRIGFHPWEDAEGHLPFTEKISELFSEEESGR